MLQPPTGAKETFGDRVPGVSYRLRETAHAVLLDEVGRLATFRVHSGLILPGGRIELGEKAVHAVVREAHGILAQRFRLERYVGQGTEHFVNRSGGFEVRCYFFQGVVVGEPEGPSLHKLVWLNRSGASRRLRRESHRWAVEQALR